MKFDHKNLILFTKYPEAGKVKTRLIPKLGPKGASEIHSKLVKHTLKEAKLLQTSRSIKVTVCYSGGDERLMKEWLGENVAYVSQSDGDLGDRMNTAFENAFSNHSEGAIIIGSDCPDLDFTTLKDAFDALEYNDVVLGPANDGGYYLIGLREAIPELFENIEWSTDEVFNKTLRAAKEMGLHTYLLKPLDDVDRPEDIEVFEKAEGRKLVDPLISVIIPTLNEEKTIKKTLSSVENRSNVEVIVADGGSSDLTIEVADYHGAKIISAPRGRANQLNKGAESAKGDILLFLHADTVLPENFDKDIYEIFESSDVVGGAFRLSIDDNRSSLRLVEFLANWRSKHMSMPYGDQGVFIRADLFKRMGSFPPMPIMEDYELMKCLKKLGDVRIAESSVKTSARRWLKLGVIKTTLLNQLIILAYNLGISEERLARWYYGKK